MRVVLVTGFTGLFVPNRLYDLGCFCSIMSRIINLKQFFLGFGAGLGDGVLNRRSGLTILLGDLFIGAGRFACRLPTGSRFIVGRGAGIGIRFVPEKSPAAPGFRARVVGARAGGRAGGAGGRRRPWTLCSWVLRIPGIDNKVCLVNHHGALPPSVQATGRRSRDDQGHCVTNRLFGNSEQTKHARGHNLNTTVI